MGFSEFCIQAEAVLFVNWWPEEGVATGVPRGKFGKKNSVTIPEHLISDFAGLLSICSAISYGFATGGADVGAQPCVR